MGRGLTYRSESWIQLWSNTARYHFGFLTTVFLDSRLWKTKQPRKRLQNFRQSCMLSTERIEIHQSQPLVWPPDLLYVMLAVCDWWVSIRSVENVWLTEISETFPWVFCFRKSRIKENGGSPGSCFKSAIRFQSRQIAMLFEAVERMTNSSPEKFERTLHCLISGAIIGDVSIPDYGSC